MKTEYDVCEGFSVEELNKQVELAFEGGWKCQGGISVAPYNNRENTDAFSDPAFEGLVFHQAVIKEIDENKAAIEEIAEKLRVAPELVSAI